MRKKYFALALTGIMLASAAMGCGNKKTPTDNDSKVTTPAPETSSDEYTLPDETTSYNNEETEEVTKPSEESTEEKEEETTTAVEEETTEKQTEGPTQKPTVKPTEAPTAKPTVAPTKPVVKPTEPPTTKPTVAPTQAPTQKPTQAPTQKPTQAPTTKPTQPPTQKPTEPPTTLAPALYIKEIDGIPYTVDESKNKAYIEEFVLLNRTFPDTVHLPYEIDGYVVDYFYVKDCLIGLEVKNLYVDERIERFFTIAGSLTKITDNLYWNNSNIENWNPGQQHNIWFTSLGNYCTLHLGVNAADIYVAQGTGFAPGSPTYYYSIKELAEEGSRQGDVGYRTFVCTDGTFSFAD